MAPWFLWSAVSSTARSVSSFLLSPVSEPDLNACRLCIHNRLSTVLQILLFLPLTLSTLSKPAFLLLSFLLFIHSLIHGTLVLLWGSPALSFLQVPVHPFLLLVCFNAFSQTVHPWLVTAASFWGTILRWSSPGFIVLEGMSSLLVAQKLGQVGKELVGEGETYQFGLLVAAAAVYVTSAWWIVMVCFSSDVLSVVCTKALYCIVISCGGCVPALLNPTRCGCHSLHLPNNHWFCSSTDECHRVVRSCIVPSL